MTISDRGIVFSGEAGSDVQSAAFPGICVTPGGRWICGFRTAPEKGSTTDKTQLTWSDDQGRSWQEPISPWEVLELNGTPGRFRGAYVTSLGGDSLVVALCWVDTSDPSRPFWHEATECLLDTRIFLSRSEDCGETWSAPQYVDTYPITMCVPVTGPILLLQNGDWACHFELNKPYGDSSVWRHGSMMAFSHDAGATWPLFSVVTNDPARRFFWWDQRPAVLPDGTILNMFWTLDNEAGAYINIQACESKDHGRTWSEIWDTGLPGQPGNPVPLLDGRLAMPYVDRSDEPKIMFRCSSDGGRTWPDDTELPIYTSGMETQTWDRQKTMQDTWAEMAEFSVGLPAAARLVDGDVLIVYYAGPETDMTAIEWARVHP